ncbi:MAG TPA: hypothetical protein PLA81_10410 [Syntrophorhabdaceae bacterium]|nr:hypothetical protein [Syntrophorhabdaceae bacterium]HPL41981.1 hypothetical protein [Syntrophorhabdaceae bacterium]HQG51120.1 hypothetical protein [Syntrophorhabdaceae bacterium]
MELTIIKEVLKSLMESRFYFVLSLKERLNLVKYVVMVYRAKSC